MTNSEKIRQMTEEELAKFLRQIEQSPDGPWQAAFVNHVCPSCEVWHLEICDRCPMGDELMWWLKQEVNRDDKDGY